MELLTAFILTTIASTVASLVGSGINAASTYATNQANKKAVEDTNQTNLQIAQENNAMQMDLAKNGVTYRMQDMANAGINPVLAAGGYGGSPQATLSTPHMQAPQAQAPMVDFNGIASALNAANNNMMMKYMLDNRLAIAQGHDATSASNNSSRNDVLRGLYQRKAEFMQNPTKYSMHVGNARQISNAVDSNEDVWEELKKFNKTHPYKYNWK